MAQFFFPDPSAPCSGELAILLQDYHAAIAWYHYTGHLALSVDRSESSSAESTDIETVLEGTEFRKARRHILPGVRNITNTAVEAFLWYISNIVARVLIKKPEMLKSSEQVRIDEIIDFRGRKDLVNFLVDRRVTRLAFGGMLDIEKYLLETLGLPLFGNDEVKARTRFLVEVRNANAHNRGRASHIFLSRTNGIRPEPCLEGELIPLGKNYHLLFEALIQTAIQFDEVCCTKFHLRRHSLARHVTDPDLLSEMRSTFAWYNVFRSFGTLDRPDTGN